MSKRLQDRILKIYKDSNQENEDQFMDKPSNFLGGRLNPELEARIREIYKESNNEDSTQFLDRPSLFLGGSIQERMKQIYSEEIQEGGKLELIDSIQKDLRKMKSDIKKGKGINRTTKAITKKAKELTKKAKNIDDTYKLSTIASRALMAFPEKREKLEKSYLGKKAVEYVQRRAQVQKPIKNKLKSLNKMVKEKRAEQLFLDNPETEQSFIDDQNEKLNSEIETYYDDQGIPYYYDPITNQTYYGDGLKCNKCKGGAAKRRVGRPCKKEGGAVKKRGRLSDIKKDENLVPFFEQPLFDSPKERLYREKKIIDNERRKLERDKLKLEQEKEKSKLSDEIKRQKIQLGQLKKQQSDLKKKITKDMEKQTFTKTEEKQAIQRNKQLEKEMKAKQTQIDKLNKAKAITSKTKVRVQSTPSKYSQRSVEEFIDIEPEYIDVEPDYDPYLEIMIPPPPPPISLNKQPAVEIISDAQREFLEKKNKSKEELAEEKRKKDETKKKKSSSQPDQPLVNLVDVLDVKSKLKKTKSKIKEEWNPEMTLTFGDGLKRNFPKKGSKEAKENMAYLRSFKKNKA